jgi:alkaline phosphatase D
VSSAPTGHPEAMGCGSVFAHAVASFDPTASSVLLWTRLGAGHRRATWEVGADEAFRVVVAHGGAETGPEHDHTVVVDADGLQPATTYWYRFAVDGVTSPVGRTRTLPEGPVDRFRLGTVCCAHFAEAPLGVYRALAEREVDLVLHLGDYTYEEAAPSGHRPHDPPHEAVTLDDYRTRLAQMRADPDTQALHVRHPMAVIWDDHDVCDNAWRHGAKRHDPHRHGPWSERLAAAVRAHHEWLPSRSRRPADPLLVSRSLVIGDLAELVLLDTRVVGRDEQAGDDGARPLDDPERSLLGDEQRDWLAGRLVDVSRRWSIVASGVVVNEIELPWPIALSWVGRLVPSGYSILDGRVMHDDQWDGYPAERRWLVERLVDRAARGGRAVLLSGDVHSSWAFEGPVDGGGQPVAVELTTPAVASAAMGRAQLPGLWRFLDRAANSLDHVVWADVTHRGYGIVEITPDEVRADVWFAHPYDQDPAAAAAWAAGFTTTAAGWPPRFVAATAPPPREPSRPDVPGGLPPRPGDLARIRRHRRVRIASKAAAGAAAAIGVAAGVAAVAIRRVR